MDVTRLEDLEKYSRMGDLQRPGVLPLAFVSLAKSAPSEGLASSACCHTSTLFAIPFVQLFVDETGRLSNLCRRQLSFR